MLGPQKPRLSATPRCNDEHVTLGLPFFDRLWLRKNGDLLKRIRLDAYLFLKFSNEGITGTFRSFALSAYYVPDARVEPSILRASGQKDLGSPNEQAARIDSHGARPRLTSLPLYI
jgi:hypothetical protein